MFVSYQKQFNYSVEELDFVICVLGENGQEVVGLMGDDILFVVFFSQLCIIYDYFCQQFVQVINLLIDLLCEVYVMLFVISIGCEMNVFCEVEGQVYCLSFKLLILFYFDFKQFMMMKEEYYCVDMLDIIFDVIKIMFEVIVKELCDKVEKMVCSGIVLLVFFDWNIVKDCLLVLVLMVVGVIQICLVD